MKQNHELLTDYLDKKLNPEETIQAEAMMREDAALAADLEYMKLAVDTVRLHSINEQVSSIRHSFDQNQTGSAKREQAIVRTMYKISLRIAAILIVLFGCALVYKYISINDQSIYNKQFRSYELTNTRSESPAVAIVEAYRNQNWNEVVSIYDNQADRSNKATFLTAMAEMEMKNFPRAIHLFENITNSGDDSFRQEAEYYLSLSYLMNHQENKSIALIHKIKSDTGNLYYPVISKISPIDIKIIELKK